MVEPITPQQYQQDQLLMVPQFLDYHIIKHIPQNR